MIQALPIAIASILLFSFSAIPTTLPSSLYLSEPLPTSPSIVNPALPSVAVAAEPGDGIVCFNHTTDKVHSVDVSDCKDVIEDMLHDQSGVMNLQEFSHNSQIPYIYTVPKVWEWNRCSIILNSGNEDEVREFRLVDAIVRAQDVLARCPPNSKHSLGGVAVLGIGKFFVAVDGPPYLGGPNQLGRDFPENLGLIDMDKS